MYYMYVQVPPAESVSPRRNLDPGLYELYGLHPLSTLEHFELTEVSTPLTVPLSP